MFPNIENVDLCNQHEEYLAWIGLQERVISWLHGIHDPEPCPPSRGLKNRKRHHFSPYPMRCEPPRAPSPVLSHKTQLEATLQSELSEFPASASEAFPIWHVQENIDQIEYRTTSLITFKVADDLPDPEYNPLITLFATDLEEEFCRLLFICNNLHADGAEADLRWKHDMSHAAMREVLDIEISIQRVLRSAQYVIEYSRHCNLDINFQTLFLQHYHYPSKRLFPEEPALEGWAYSGEASQFQPYYTQDVGEQQLSGFDCQAFTGLIPDNHDVWTFG